MAGAEDPRIFEDRFSEAEYISHRHIAKLAPEIKREHLFKPEFWSHVSAKLSRWDEIILCPDDGGFYGRLLVTSCGSGWAKVHVLEWHDLDSGEQSTAEGRDQFEIINKGGSRKHVVIRKSDQVVLQEGIYHKAAAEAWLDNYLNNLSHEQRLAA